MLHRRILAAAIFTGLTVTCLWTQERGSIRDRIRARRAGKASKKGEQFPGEMPSGRPAASCGSNLNVGYRLHTFSNGLRAAIWYPATAAEEGFEYPSDLKTSMAANAAPAACGDRYPLVVFSHGYGGCGTQSCFFTEELARRGYIVVGPDHKDAQCKVDQPRGRYKIQKAEAPFRQPQKWSDKNYVNRRDDVKRVIDEMLGSRDFGPRIDRGAIGVMGHSLGGYTAGALVGGWPSWKDNRIKAALLFSPFVTPFIEHRTLKDIDIPIMYQGGDRDIGVTPYVRKQGGAYDLSNPPKYYLELESTGHFDWSIAVCKGQGTVRDCVTETQNGKLITQAGIWFFERHLRNKNVSEMAPAKVAGVLDYRASN